MFLHVLPYEWERWMLHPSQGWRRLTVSVTTSGSVEDVLQAPPHPYTRILKELVLCTEHAETASAGRQP